MYPAWAVTTAWSILACGESVPAGIAASAVSTDWRKATSPPSAAGLKSRSFPLTAASVGE